ncbi:MAG: AzlD domain-containing protein [Deltaproteobacteria bacterium]|jgi:branched-subunit amino acid transport protein|nr:AzlD domain-containing protein [Deltaproteobacteria bacterium]
MSAFLACVLVASAGTLALRLFFLGRDEPVPSPDMLRAAMEHLPVSILSALVFREFILGGPGLTARLFSASVAVLLALTLRKDIVTILGGLLAYWAFTALSPLSP